MNTIEYIKPEIEIIEIGLENVIATSKELNDDHNGWPVLQNVKTSGKMKINESLYVLIY